jgi:NADH:ubiquinone oxidoreductase subunit 6 (subunit J)
MTLEVMAFWAFAIVLVGSALAVVLSKNLFHSVLWLALALTGTAGVFLLLNAEFLAGVQILLYAGGVVTVVVFAIVVTERLVGTRLSQTNRHVVRGAVASGALLALLLGWIRRSPPVSLPSVDDVDVTRAIGSSLLTQFVLPFELLGVLLVVALIGASYFARPEE